MRIFISAFVSFLISVSGYLVFCRALNSTSWQLKLKEETSAITIKNYNEIFDGIILKAEKNLDTFFGPGYQHQFNLAIRELDSSCFQWASRNGGAIGKYELVGIVSATGKLNYPMVNPVHRYSNCVLEGVSSISFPMPPKENWEVYTYVNVLP